MAFDMAIFQWVESALWNPVLDSIMKVITTLGDGGILWIVVGLALVFPKKTRKYGVMVIVGLLFSLLINDYILKPLIARPRPFDLDIDWWKAQFVYPEIIKHPDSWSFPSGHTSSSFAAATALVFTKRKSLYIPGGIMAVLIAFSRIYVHVHYPTDVIAGVVVGILYGLLAYLVVSRLAPVIQRAIDKRRQNKQAA